MSLKMMLKKLYNKLAGKVNNIDTSDFVLKTKYQTQNKIKKENSWYNWFC